MLKRMRLAPCGIACSTSIILSEWPLSASSQVDTAKCVFAGVTQDAAYAGLAGPLPCLGISKNTPVRAVCLFIPLACHSNLSGMQSRYHQHMHCQWLSDWHGCKWHIPRVYQHDAEAVQSCNCECYSSKKLNLQLEEVCLNGTCMRLCVGLTSPFKMSLVENLCRGLVTRNGSTAVQHFHDNHFRLDPFWPALSREFTPYKPHPGALLHICKQWHILPEEAIMVGDSAKDDVSPKQHVSSCLLCLNDT